MSGASAWNFPACLAFTIGPGLDAGGQEGGYSDDPNDSGGPTNFGVTQASWSEWLKHPVSVAEIAALTRADVVPFYTAKYWNACRCWGLSPGVDLTVFDFAVNAGAPTSAMLLQQAVGTTQDGIVGPITALAAKGMGAVALIARLHDLHSQHYESLADFPRYGTDWLRRIDECRDTAMAMITAITR